MSSRRRYAKRAGQDVVAVRLDLDTEGFTYEKWGATQRCKAGDWIVCNDGDTYTVDREVFERTYRPIAPGRYAKTGVVWAERAAADGAIDTKEGTTRYRAGDYLVFNDADGEDGWAVEAAIFEKMYEPAE